ncbi:MAG: DNA replication/repair protein RecF [Legionellaceae bacterium]|nr:DNA replication/repair protein RecF [Legionellaceae bacterium]
MILSQLNIHHVRNISAAQITLHPRFNIFHGMNGSGKTSILEAIYLLGSGHSFRTRETNPLIAHNEPALTVFARADFENSISIQKSSTGTTQVKINQQACHRSSELAHFLPCQLVYQDIFQIIDAGPSIRRSVLDWGLFHVKQSYHALWKEYRHILKQRNALLRQKASPKEFIPWDKQLVELANELDALRLDYFNEWSDVFQTILAQLTHVPCTIHYYKGWDRKGTGKSLTSILLEQFTSDCQRQYTHAGSHQADIIFDSASLKAKQTLSRGQQKIILIALKLAQAHLLAMPCVYLFDDITAELDAQHVERLVRCLSQLKGQFFLTTIDINQLTSHAQLQDSSVFSLTDGVISQRFPP